MFSAGNLGATGVKPFIQPHPTDPDRTIQFICLEGNEAGTYFRGQAALAKGRAEVAIPEEWQLVTEADGITVQVTAIGRSSGNRIASTGVTVSATTRLARVGTIALPSLGSCAPGWASTFGGLPGVDNAVQSLTVFDDGGGPALYVGGNFTVAGGVVANRIARWDGSSWTPLGSGMNGPVQALAVFDDGGGAALYA